MKPFAISILVLITCFSTYGQVKENPNGQLFEYNGNKIYYEDTGDGEPLLLLHSFFGTADQWQPHVEVYAKQFRTIAIDMIGHGRSDIFNKDDLNFKHGDFAKIILALLDSLNLNQVNAIGGSSGGMTLLHLNIIQPERFKSVIAIGAQIYFSQQTREWVTKMGINNFMKWAQPHGPEKQELLAKQFLQMQSLFGDPSFTPDILGTIKANWLVVQGDNDDVIPLKQALEMYKYIPNSRLWIVPNGGHLPHLEPAFQPEFFKVSLEFLNEKWDNKN